MKTKDDKDKRIAALKKFAATERNKGMDAAAAIATSFVGNDTYDEATARLIAMRISASKEEVRR